MSTAVAKIAKPNMAFIQARSLYKHIFISLGLSIAGGFALHEFVNKPYIKKHEDFNATYNPYEDFERMRNLGLFESAPPDWVLKEREEKKKLKQKHK